MAIGYGFAVPKGKTRKQLKAQKDREDAKQFKVFRDAVWDRERRRLGLDDSFALCQGCGELVSPSLGSLFGQVHHVVSRRHKATRIDPDNGRLLCRKCHNNAHRREF